MKRLCLFLLFFSIIPAFALMSPDLTVVMEKKKLDELIPINIVLKEQMDIQTLRVEVHGLTKVQKRARVAELLKEFAAVKQQSVLQYLMQMEQRGKVKDIKPLWIHNGLFCRATKDVVILVQSRQDVEYVDYDLKPIKLPEPEHSAVPPDVTREIAWGVLKVRADQVWALGFTGQGIVVGVIDSGVNYNHVDLASHMWTDPNYPNHGWNFDSNNNNPMDTDGHGTHCAGSIASDGTAGSQCGIAPEAEIMACKVRIWADSVAEEQIFSAMQFVVSPPLSPANGGDLISMSLGWQYQWGPRRATWRQSCDNVGVAGIVMCIAAGNERTSNSPPNAVRCPGDVPPPWQNPENGASGAPSDVISVGATDINDLIGYFSSPGPVTWQSISPYNDYVYPPGLKRPDVSAPGVNIKSCAYNNNTGYLDGWNGTSMATPHTAGLVALMLHKNPDLTPLEIDSLLETTAIDLGPSGKDNDFGAGRIDALNAVSATPVPGVPETPNVISPFDFAKLCNLMPNLRFTTTDPQGDDIIYRVYWDTDTSFTSADSATTPPYASGVVVDFTVPSPMTDGVTYWWRVRAADTSASGDWSSVTECRSYTVDTSLPSNTCSWFQTTGAQFIADEFYGTQVQGDSVVLRPTGNISDTLLSQNFEAGGIPSGWTVVDGNGDGVQWMTGTTGDLGTFTPPNYDTRYAYYSDDNAGNGVINYNEALISPTMHIPGTGSALNIQYGYGFRLYESGEVFEVRARFFNGSWGSWSTIATYTTSSTGTANIDLTSYLPADSAQFAWAYHDEASLSHYGWASACDNILVVYSYSFTNDQGTVTSTPVYYGDLSAVYARPHWGKAVWCKAETGDSIGIQVEYYNNTWQLIPDIDLPGNSSGFFAPSETAYVALSGLDTLTYETLRLVGIFQRVNIKSPNEPAMLDWEIGNLSGGETEPPEPFSLISPPDSALLSYPRPSFIWHATYDTGSGLRDYNIYIGGQLRHTGTDTTWTADYDLPEGYSDWYVVARDSANNARNSNETWIVVIDTTGPEAVSLISPANNCYLNSTSVGFIWHRANDNVSGIQYYTLQYALNSSFTQGLVETTWVDTAFTTALSDTVYYWRVRATDIANNDGVFSATWQFEIDSQSPSAPVLVSPTGGVWLTDTLVNMQWTAVLDIVSSHNQRADFRAPIRYILQIDTTTSFASPIFIDTLTTTSTTVSLAEAYYYWRVRAYDLAGNQGPFSVADSFGVDISPPTTVSLIAPSNNAYQNSSAVDFTWHSSIDDLSGVDHYVLQYALNSSFTQGLVETTLVDTAFTQVLSDTTYYWHVLAVDAASNEGAFSATWQFEVDTQQPSVPNLVTPIGGIWYSDTLLDFEWSPVRDLAPFGHRTSVNRKAGGSEILLSPVQYILEIDTSVSFSAPFIVDTCMSATSSVALGEGFYYWRVCAFDLAGNLGAYSDHDSVGVDITAPYIESTTVWNDSSFLGPYEILTRVEDILAGVDSVMLYYRRDEDPDWDSAAMHYLGSNWYLDTIPAVSNYDDSVRYYVEACDRAQPGNVRYDPSGAPANYYCFVAGVTGIEGLTTGLSVLHFSIGQNPVRSKVVFSIFLTTDAMIELCIYDVSGRLMAKPVCGRIPAGDHEVIWNPAINSGVYFYSFDSPWEYRTGKIVLIK